MWPACPTFSVRPARTKHIVTLPRTLAGLLIAVMPVLAVTACGASIDGDQWVDVTVTNTTASPVTLDTHPAHRLASGQATVLHVNSNNNPQAVRVWRTTGQVLGCLTFLFHTTSPAMRSVSASDIVACPKGVRTLP